MNEKTETGKLCIPDGYYKLETCELALYVKISDDEYTSLTEITKEEYIKHVP